MTENVLRQFALAAVKTDAETAQEAIAKWLWEQDEGGYHFHIARENHAAAEGCLDVVWPPDEPYFPEEVMYI